jgi:protein-S-isoprenylcysteine O-methyltransferase Ste14
VPEHPQPDVYNFYALSLAQRIFLTITVASCVALAWWILLGSGLTIIGACFGRSWHQGNALRCIILTAALTVYFLRLFLTQFVFLKRGVRWSEAFAIAPWLLFIYLWLSIEAARNAAPFAIPAYIGLALFLIGSWMNTWSEHQRNVWKKRPENRGHLYTGGLFRYTRHPNYFGDVLSFSGLCLITGRWVTAIIPALLIAGFVFANIPILDRHLQEHYGDEFTRYAARTRKLIPFIY